MLCPVNGLLHSLKVLVDPFYPPIFTIGLLMGPIEISFMGPIEISFVNPTVGKRKYNMWACFYLQIWMHMRKRIQGMYAPTLTYTFTFEKVPSLLCLSIHPSVRPCIPTSKNGVCRAVTHNTIRVRYTKDQKFSWDSAIPNGHGSKHLPQEVNTVYQVQITKTTSVKASKVTNLVILVSARATSPSYGNLTSWKFASG